jgi:hypothetical protein
MDFISNQNYSLYVKPNSSQSEVFEEEGLIIVRVKSPALENKANEEVVKLFKKKFKITVKIVSGFKSKKKVIKVE